MSDLAACLQRVSDRGLRALFYEAEADEVSSEQGPYRILVIATPSRAGSIVVVASGESWSTAMDDLMRVPNEVLDRVGLERQV